MLLPPLITIIAALIGLAFVSAIGVIVFQPARPLLSDAGLSLTKITPNADGSDDVTSIHYTLNRNAKVTIAFTNQATRERFVFRNAEQRAADSYSVLFSGIVNNNDESKVAETGKIETRLIPNGVYDWEIKAEGTNNETAQTTGTLTVSDADTTLPAITEFSISPTIFTPNQDGIDDRVNINTYLNKAATLTVYLEDAQGHRYYVPEHVGGRKAGEVGNHYFDWDGGVDDSITPPADGEYKVVAVAEDTVGQRVSRIGQVTIKDGGLPNAEIVAQSTGGTLYWNTLPYKDSYLTDLTTQGEKIAQPEGVTSTLATFTMPLGDLLIFRLTVSNYGSTPIRTVGPWPGTVYQYDQKAAAMNDEAINGVWRVGIECERTDTSYPWRWAIGSQDQLTKVDREGQTLWYLMPGQQAVVWGAVRITRLIPTRNPQECWAGLIHEDVAIPALQNHVGAVKVELTQVDPK